MSASQTDRRDLSWLPSWVERLGVPVWVCDSEQRLRLIDQKAARAFGTSLPPGGDGRACYEVLSGCDESGAPHCRPDCAVISAFRAGRSHPPFEFQMVGADGERHWFRIMPLPLTAPDGSYPWIVHVAIDMDRAHRLESYIKTVASRSHISGRPSRTKLSVLTSREREVLDCLARDMDPQRVAVVLGVSYSTVRNHIQHMLAKLDLHSIEEAVAVRLLA